MQGERCTVLRMPELHQAFGRSVAIERARRDWTQVELARRAGIERAHLSRIEAGAVDPGLALQEKIAAAFGLTLSELMRTVDEERQRRQRRQRRQLSLGHDQPP